MPPTEYTHINWNAFAPRGIWPNQETLSAYLIRMRLNEALNHIPDEVFDQWLYPHYNNEQFIKNYGWLDFAKFSFNVESWPTEKVQDLNLLSLFQNTIAEIDSPFQRVLASPEDMMVWQSKGTWRIPPIVLDVGSVIMNAPPQAELIEPFQLVEGHSRLRNLLISIHQNLFLAPSHQIYLMKYQ